MSGSFSNRKYGKFSLIPPIFRPSTTSALSPSPVYPHNQAAIKIASLILVPILLASAIIPAHIWSTIISFSIGIGFFAQPLLIRAAKAFVKLVPDWQERLDLRNSILSGVPTDVQLVMHLLRVSEARYQPIPSPPAPPTSKHLQKELEKTSMDSESVHDTETDPELVEGGEEDDGLGEKVVKKGKGKILGGLKAIAAKVSTFRGDVRDTNEDLAAGEGDAEGEKEGKREKVGGIIDRVFYQSSAVDDGTADGKYSLSSNIT